MQTSTFLHALPASAMERNIVAKVEILDTSVNEQMMKRVSRVIVVKNIKNAPLRTQYHVLSDIHTCATDRTIKAGESYYIAATENNDGQLQGSWKGIHQRLGVNSK